MVRGRTTRRGRITRGRGQPSNDEVVSRPTRNFSKGIPQPSTPFHGRILDCGSFPNDIRKQIGCLVKGNIPDDEVSWAQWSDHNKTLIWNKFLTYYTFEDLDYARSAFEKYLTINYPKWMNKARADAKIEAGVERLDESCKNFPPRYLTKNQWEGMMTKFLASEFQDKSKKNSDNRKNNDEYLVYKGGSASFEANARSLSLRLGRPASFSESYLATHMPLNDRGKSIMSDYETYNSEELAKRRTEDEDDDEDEEEDEDEEGDDESTQGSTSYRRRKPVFLEDTHEAWMRATGGKKKGRILGMRPGDQTMLSQQSKKSKSKEHRRSKEEIERKKNEEFDLRVEEAVAKQIEVIKQQQKIEMEQLEKRLMERFASMQPSTNNTIVPSDRWDEGIPSINTIKDSSKSKNTPLDLSSLTKKK